jgi:hypothetical protein
VTDGVVIDEGTVTNWAITDDSNLLAVGALSSPRVVSTAFAFSMPAVDINYRGGPES